MLLFENNSRTVSLALNKRGPSSVDNKEWFKPKKAWGLFLKIEEQMELYLVHLQERFVSFWATQNLSMSIEKMTTSLMYYGLYPPNGDSKTLPPILYQSHLFADECAP